MNRWAASSLLLIVAAVNAAVWNCPATAVGQVIIIDGHRPIPIPRPRPAPADYRIKSVDVQADIRDQAAKVQLTQTLLNTGSGTLDAQIIFPLADAAQVSGMTLLVDGKELPGKLHKKEDARRIYEEIVRRQRDPALLEYLGQGMYQTRVFPIPAQAERRVEIRYTQLLRKDSGVVDFLLPLSSGRQTGKPTDTLNLTVRVEAAAQIKTIYSPTHTLDIQRPDNTHAVCKLSLTNVFAADDFRLFYGTTEGAVGMSLLSYRPNEQEDGYFLLLASPEVRQANAAQVDKTVIFVVDRSGSMSGEKIEQARGALKFVLGRLNPGDTFNIVAYDSGVEAFRPELQRADESTLKAANGFADGLFSGGSTNIDGALQAALRMVQDANRPTYLLFLTDGLPTAGEVTEVKIAANAKQAGRPNVRMFTFGVGYDVNSRLLDRLARDFRGQSVYVRPKENIEAQVALLYGKIGSPQLTDLKLTFAYDPPEAAEANLVSRTYPRQLTDLFQGEQLVLVGRYRRHGGVKVSLAGHVSGDEKVFAMDGAFVPKSADESLGFVEKLWAQRRIGEIIDELDLKGQNQELVDELVQLSIRHGIITAYTSFLAEERADLAARDENLREAGEQLRRGLSRAEGKSGSRQRAFKGDLQTSAAPLARGAGSFGSFGGGARAGASPAFAGRAPAGVVYQDVEGDAQATDNVRNVGQKTFFRKDGQWQDSTVTPEQKKQAVRIQQFSKEYFDLAAKHGGTLGKYLNFDEAVIVNLDGKTYEVVPEASGS